MTNDLLQLLSVIHRGRENAIRQEDAARLLGTTAREIQKMTLELNQAGYPVLSTTRPPYGIYLAVTQNEVEEYARTLRRRALEVLRRYGVVRRIKLNPEPSLLQGAPPA